MDGVATRVPRWILASLWIRTGTRPKQAVSLIDRRPLLLAATWFAGATRGRDASAVFRVVAHGYPAYVGGKCRTPQGEERAAERDSEHASIRPATGGLYSGNGESDAG